MLKNEKGMRKVVLLGTIVNAVAVILAGIVGAFIGKRLPKRICDTVMHGMALCIIFIGIDGALSGENTLIAIISIAAGAVIGELIDLDKWLDRFGEFIQKKLTKGSSGSFGEGFVTATLLICVGAWAITGAMDAGLRGEHTSFYAKAMVDAVACCIMATTLGVGVALSGVMLFVYQGALALASTLVEPYLTTTVVNELTSVGSLLIIAIGLNMLGLTKIKVVNLLPAVFIPILLCQFM